MTMLITTTLLALTAWTSSTPTALQATSDRGIWHDGSYNSALRLARQEDKPMLIALVPDWSDYSKRMVAETFPDPTVVALMADMVCLKYEQEDSRSLQVARMYNVMQFPTVVVTRPDGTLDDVVIGFFPAQPLVSELQRILAGRNTLADFIARVAAAPDDLAVRYAYAVKLDELGDAAGYQRELDAIRAADPDGETLIGARLLQSDVWAQIATDAPGAEDTWDLAPIETLLEDVPLAEARFEGWIRIADFERERQRRAECIAARRRAGEHVAEQQYFVWAARTINYVLGADQGDLDPEIGTWTLGLAEQVEQRAIDFGQPDENGQVGVPPGGDYNLWLAENLDLLARAQLKYAGDERHRLALATSKRCVELAPDNPDYRSRVELLASRK
jgi:hypothetical protein